jgi:protein TonB
MSAEFTVRESGWRTFARWSFASALVIVTHLAGAWVIARQHSEEASAGAAVPAIMLELAPLPVAPAAEPLDVPPGPETSEYQPEPVSERPETETPVETKEPPPEPAIDLPEPAEPVFEELPMPDLPPVPEPAEAVLPLPPSKKQVTEKVKEKSPERPVREARRLPRQRQMKPQAKATMAPPRSQAAPVRASAAPAPGIASASSLSPAKWRGALVAHLNRTKRYPPEARMRREEGVVRLSFSIDRSGRVIGFRVAGSSGSPALDREALAMIQRASPLPAPPPEVAGGRIDLTVPVHFNVN